GDVVAVEAHAARQAQPLGDHGDEVPVHVEVLEPAVGAVADQQQRPAGPRVQAQAVTGAELARLVAGAAEALDVLAVLIEQLAPVLPVAVGDEHASVGADGDGGGVVLALVLVLAAGLHHLFGGDRPHDRAVEPELERLLALEVGGVDELLAVLVADLHAVDAGQLFAAEAFEELAVGRVDHDGGVAAVHAEVDVALLVDDDPAVGGAEDAVSGG